MRIATRISGLLLAGSLAWTAPGASMGPAEALVSKADQRDAESYAEEFGTSVEEALRRLDLQRQVGVLGELLEIEAKESFGGLWIEHTPDLRVMALFTKPGEARELLSEEALGELAPRVFVRPARTTLAELEAQLDEAQKQLQRAKARADLWINVRANRVEVMTTDRAVLSRLLSSKSLELPPAAAVVEVEALFGPQADLRGGRPIADFSAGTGCTSGFAVRSSTGQMGLATAGHCDNGQTYQDSSVPLSFRSERFGGSHDVQWHSAGCHHDIRNQVDDGLGIRTINGIIGRGAQAIGTFVCKHGRTTGRTCGVIESKSVCPSYIPGGNSTFVAVRGSGGVISDFGDSGGPWFAGNRAYGILSGGDRATLSIYMAVDSMSSLGYSVLANQGSVTPYVLIDCSNTRFDFSCFATGRNGTPPYTFSNWSYLGSAYPWGSSGASAWGRYGFSGCTEGDYNTLAVEVVDSCGRVGFGRTQFLCPGTSCELRACDEVPY